MVAVRSLMDHLGTPFFFQCTKQEVYQVCRSGKSLSIFDRPGGLLILGSKRRCESIRIAQSETTSGSSSTLKGYEVDMDHLVGINQNWLITLPATRISISPFFRRHFKSLSEFSGFPRLGGRCFLLPLAG